MATLNISSQLMLIGMQLHQTQILTGHTLREHVKVIIPRQETKKLQINNREVKHEEL
jgi:hypothetical protein